MAESLEDFLNLGKPSNSVKVNGSMMCQECDETVNDGILNEDSMVLVYRCSKNHESKVKI